MDLIDWKKPVYEPPLTENLTILEVRQFLDAPMVVPDWPCHSQSIERCVKNVTEAAGKVYSHEKRDGVIKAQELSRKLMSENNSKKDLFGLITKE